MAGYCERCIEKNIKPAGAGLFWAEDGGKRYCGDCAADLVEELKKENVELKKKTMHLEVENVKRQEYIDKLQAEIHEHRRRINDLQDKNNELEKELRIMDAAAEDVKSDMSEKIKELQEKGRLLEMDRFLQERIRKKMKEDEKEEENAAGVGKSCKRISR